MKLYTFESCPFCVRVRVMLGLKKLDAQLVYLAAGELPEALEGRVESLVVPMLELAGTASAPPQLLTESAEIIRWLDSTFGSPVLDSYRISPALQQWLDANSRTMDSLFYPRMPAAQLPELASTAARDFFLTTRPGKLGCSLAQAIQETGHHIAVLQQQMPRLEQILQPQSLLAGEREIGFDDICAFSALRNLQLLELPAVSDLLSPMMAGFMETIESRAALAPIKPVSDQLSLEALSA